MLFCIFAWANELFVSVHVCACARAPVCVCVCFCESLKGVENY